MAEKILVVEDDRAILDGLGAALRADGYEVECVEDGRAGLERARAGAPALLILDIMLPGMSGFEVAKKLRDEGRPLPIILLTARSEEDDRVLGLELGADDYVTKPFSVRELLARVRSALRRVQPARPRRPQSYGFGDVSVDFKRQAVSKAGRPVELSAREFRILSYFIDHAGEMLSREQLLAEIWGYDAFPTTRTVDNHILRLRKKIEDDPEAPRFLLTRRGAGYVFEPGAGGPGRGE
jgi:two-component system alkaline phosphatase synthesis response regulator PhoP